MIPGRPPLPPGPYLVVGLGRAGLAATDALLRAGTGPVLAWDASTSPTHRRIARELSRRGVEVRLGGDGLEALAPGSKIATVVKSPGVGFDLPLIRQAAERGLPILDELELGWRLSPSPIVGVTGTNGKSTTAALIAAVLQAGGHRVQPAGNSELVAPLSAVDHDGWVVCEVSSFQLEGTDSFLPEIAVFTNLTLEHLDRHGTMDCYGALKRRMFIRGQRAAEAAVVNLDDPFGEVLARSVRQAGGRVVGYGFSDQADVRLLDATWDMREARFSLATPAGEVECATSLPGAHNASNVAAAMAVGYALGVRPESIVDAVAGVAGPPGRWKLIDGGQPFDVLVDYAHTPDGIRRTLEAVRTAIATRGGGGRLATVFGAVGLSEPDKAHESGRWACALSDHLILTTGSAPDSARIPRLAELRRGASAGRGGSVEVVLDRRAAIERAIGLAEPGDVVAVLGLGALGRLALDAAGTLWVHSDREVALEACACAS